MLRTKKQIINSLDRWRERGWVTPEGETAIRDELTSRTSLLSLSSTLAILGAILIGFAAMSFVAANWTAIPRLVRVVMLLVALWAAYAGAGWLLSRGYQKFAHASLLAGVGIFGANIMLIAQMFHISGNPTDAVLVWAAGALLTGLVFRSMPTVVLALLLFGLWSVWEIGELNNVHWWFLPALAVTTFGFIWQDWRPGYYLSALALSIWIIVSAIIMPGGPFHEFIALCGAALMALAFGLQKLHGDSSDVAPIGYTYGAGLLLFGLFALQVQNDQSIGAIIAFAVVILALLLAVMAWANRMGDRRLVWIAYIGFAGEILYIYFRTIGTLMGTSMFFLSAGLIVIGLAVVAMRVHKLNERRAIEGSLQ